MGSEALHQGEGAFFLEDDDTPLSAEELAERLHFSWADVTLALRENNCPRVPQDRCAAVRALPAHLSKEEYARRGLSSLLYVTTTPPK
ncbi:MAG: hypothetical protein ABIJ03_02175 [Patescibacteria group bacterium]|nr:hypothetical protein [Patescibacteria group bacterium]